MTLSRLRFVLALPAVIALVCGVLSGLARLGWGVPMWAAELAGVHGALMIGAFFGTLIGLERAVAIARGWPYLAPLAAGSGGLWLILDPASPWPAWLMCVAAAVMSAACASVWWRERASHLALLVAAALAWLGGNLVWATGAGMMAATPLWASFLILTIAAERLELSRLMRPSRYARWMLAGVVALLFAGALAALASDAGLRLYAAALGLLALWLLRYDIARRTVRVPGLTRYMAVCLLGGYLWLLIAAGLGLGGAFEVGSAWRDAGLHALLLGFVMAMVFGHAPVIVPALTRLRFVWNPAFYAALGLLHASLLLRVGADLAASFTLRQWGALGNALSILCMVVLILGAVRRRERAP